MSGKFNIAGPVNELTAMDMDPSIPMLPMCSWTDLWRALIECERENRGFFPVSTSDSVDATVNDGINGVFSVFGAIVLF